MKETLMHYMSAIVLFPLLGATIAGFFGKVIGRRATHAVTIMGVAISFVCALIVAKGLVLDGVTPVNENIYTWAQISVGSASNLAFHVGFLLDPLTAVMMVTVTFVSLLVHIYTIGYMAEDPGYQRFFAYISLFTFMMLMLVSSNNFLQLFFGWEGVGLVSYLLISFWFFRDSAANGGIKAFLVNRVGDLGFLLGIAAVLTFTGSLDYATVFNHVPQILNQYMTIWPGYPAPVITVMCLLLFVGAMGKSAQVPLHVWLPESMEGPTPISALIHAATMVTAGVFMVARMSPLFEYSQVALSFVLVIGATGALFLGFVAVVQHDIKRVIAYSTLSQLGYMMAALGASAYAAGIFHLMTHAAFKALLFLAAGSVIIAMHHEQDMRKMGGLRKYMPITYVTFLIGTLSLSAIPPFAGFYSKDSIIEAVREAQIPGATYAYYCVLFGAFVTALYSFRMFFLTFHTKERMDEKTRSHLHETPWVVWLPLVILAVPSVIAGGLMIKPMLFSEPGWLGESLKVLPQNNVLIALAEEFHGAWALAAYSVQTLTFWLAIGGIVTAWVAYIAMPTLPELLVARFRWIYHIIVNKYGFDDFNQTVFVRGGRGIGTILFQVSDRRVIDGWGANGLGRLVHWVSSKVRLTQSGYLYHYALAMVLGLFIFLVWLVY